MTFYDGSLDMALANNSRTQVVKRVPARSRVLEIGCATGFMSEYLARVLACRVTGVECDAEAACAAVGRCEQVVIGDIETDETIARCAGEYDVIILADVLEHLRRPELVLQRLVRYVAPRGRVIASIPNIAHWSMRWRLLVGHWEYRDRGILDGNHLRFFTLKSSRELFQRAGLEITSMDGVYAFPRFFFPPGRLQARIARLVPGLFMMQFILEASPGRPLGKRQPPAGTESGG